MTTAATATNSNGTNGASVEDKSTALGKLHAEWVAGGSKRPSKATAKPMVDAYKKAKSDREALEAKIAALKAKENEAAISIVKAFGKGRFTLDGETFQAASRGESVFLRLEKPAIEL